MTQNVDIEGPRETPSSNYGLAIEPLGVQALEHDNVTASDAHTRFLSRAGIRWPTNVFRACRRNPTRRVLRIPLA